MLEIGEAQQKVLEDVPVLGKERLHILEALGRVLAQDVRAKRDVPAGDNSAMDGYCLRAADAAEASEDNPVKLQVIGDRACRAAIFGDCAIRGGCEDHDRWSSPMWSGHGDNGRIYREAGRFRRPAQGAEERGPYPLQR